LFDRRPSAVRDPLDFIAQGSNGPSEETQVETSLILKVVIENRLGDAGFGDDLPNCLK